MDSWEWMEILREHPDKAAECPCWGKFSPMEWMLILEVHPQFADKCPWEEFDGYSWSTLLRAQPQFADKCNWDELDGAYWWWLLDKQPQFVEKCAWEKLSGHDWALVLNFMPEAVRHCRWEKFSTRDWSELLRMQPQFANKCQCWDEFTDNDWLWLGERLSDFKKSMACFLLLIFWKLPNATSTAIFLLMKSARCWILITIPSPIVPMMPTPRKLTRFQQTSLNCSTNRLFRFLRRGWLLFTDAFLKAFSSSPVLFATATFPKRNECCVVNLYSM